jgi:hypothetical protein
MFRCLLFAVALTISVIVGAHAALRQSDVLSKNSPVAVYPAGSPDNVVFGVAEEEVCGSDIPRPETQGLLSDAGGQSSIPALAGAESLQDEPTGFLMEDNPWPDTFPATQMGSWLIRDAPAVPEPGPLLLAGAGLLLLSGRRRA